MIWATISSQSCFCWLYRASPSLAAKNIINLISVLTTWWCPCVESSFVLLLEGVCHIKRCSTSLIIREMQIKTTMRYHYTQSGWLLSKSLQAINAGEGGEKGTLLHCWWQCKLVQPLWKTVWRFLKKLENRTTIWPSNPTSEHIHQGNQIWKRHVHPNVHRSTVYNSQDMEAT